MSCNHADNAGPTKDESRTAKNQAVSRNVNGVTSCSILSCISRSLVTRQKRLIFENLAQMKLLV